MIITKDMHHPRRLVPVTLSLVKVPSGVINKHTEMVVEVVNSIGDQVVSAAREGGSTSIIPELFKLIERMEVRMSELNTRVSKLEVLVELLMKKKLNKNSTLFQC
jgi:hypothetical protein